MVVYIGIAVISCGLSVLLISLLTMSKIQDLLEANDLLLCKNSTLREENECLRMKMVKLRQDM